MKPSSISAVEDESAKRYSKVLVLDFEGALSTADEKQGVENAALKAAEKTFADLVAKELTQTGSFSKVIRSGSVDENTLVMNGLITEYNEAGSALQALAGLGSGKSLFEAKVNYRQPSGKILGTIEVDKSSWSVGKAQDSNAFMLGAARKAAQEATKLAK